MLKFKCHFMQLITLLSINRTNRQQQLYLPYQKDHFNSTLQFIMETKENRKVLFAEIIQPSFPQKGMLHFNNWNKPPPFQYHIINSPTLTFQLATLAPQMHQSLPDFFKKKDKELRKVPKRSKDRSRFKKLSEQVKQLEQSLADFKDLRMSQLLAYKQNLLADYLSKFIEDVEIECLEKGEYLKRIWNLLIRIFEGIFERILGESKQKQKEYLKEGMVTHNSYQNKLQQYQVKNSQFKENDNKYQNVIHELMKKIENLSTELKGQKILFDKTTSVMTEITHKYQELKSEYLEILVNGFTEVMTRQQAQHHLADKQILLFSKQVTFGNHRLRSKKQRQNKSQMISNHMDINLLMEKIQAENEISFQIEQQIEKQVNYVNQRVQTVSQVLGDNAEVQCDYISRSQQGILKEKSSQTNQHPKILQRNQITQTVSADLSLKKYQILETFSFVHYPAHFNDSFKLICECSKQNEPSKKHIQVNDAFTSITIKEISDANDNHQQKNIPLDINEKGKEAKMTRINSRQSNRRSKLYLQRVVKTQSSDFKEGSSSQIMKKTNKNIRVSSFLILQNLKQEVIKNVSNFKKNQNMVFNLQQKLSLSLLRSFQVSKSIKECLNTQIVRCQQQLQIGQNSFLKNMQLAHLNQQVQSKLQSWEVLHNKKAISLLPAHKCLKDINQIFKLTRKFLSLGSTTINLITITFDYLSALEGKPVTINNNHKKFIDFFRSCLNLYGEHYLIRNFILLCGLDAPDKDQRLVKMSKISFDSLKQKIDLDRMNRTSEFKFYCDKKETSSLPSQAKMIYYSEVCLYFQLLDALNCSQNKEELSKYYTTFDRFEQVISKISQHYRNGHKLIFMIKEAVQLSIEDWGSQTQCKLNIYKCLQLVFDKIIHSKMQMENEFNHILDQYEGSHTRISPQFIHQMIYLTALTESQYAYLTLIANQTYQLDKMSDLVTFFMIEGLSIDLSPFSTVEKDHKVAIIKKLMANDNKKGLLANILQSYQKKRMKKNDFNLLLRNIWIEQSSNIFRTVLGQNLLCLFQGTIPYGGSTKGIGFHKASYDKFNLFD